MRKQFGSLLVVVVALGLLLGATENLNAQDFHHNPDRDHDHARDHGHGPSTPSSRHQGPTSHSPQPAARDHGDFKQDRRYHTVRRAKDVHQRYHGGSKLPLDNLFHFNYRFDDYAIDSVILIGRGQSKHSRAHLHVDGKVVDTGDFLGRDGRVVLRPKHAGIIGHDVHRAKVYLDGDVYIDQVIVNFREPELRQVALDQHYHGSGTIHVLHELGLSSHQPGLQLPWVELWVSGDGGARLYIDGIPVGHEARIFTPDSHHRGYDVDKIHFELPERYSDLSHVGRMEIRVWGRVRVHTLGAKIVEERY